MNALEHLLSRFLFDKENNCYTCDANLTVEEFEGVKRELAELRESLQSMLGWALYGEDCDPWYFSDDRAKGFKEDVEKARALAPHGTGSQS